MYLFSFFTLTLADQFENIFVECEYMWSWDKTIKSYAYGNHIKLL